MISQALDDKKEDFAKLREEALRASQKFTEVKAKMQEKKKEADSLAPLVDEDGNPTPLKEKLEELQVDEIHEVEACLEEAERLLNQYDANPEVIRQYEKLKDEIELISSQLEDSTDTRERNLRSIESMRKDWEQRLEHHIDKINSRFTLYMSEMGCTGEVRLTKGPAQDEGEEKRANFKHWGIEILVSFREGTKAHVLSKQRHSGGERSVSTILYLMALQDLMVAPFRCVDEINQVKRFVDLLVSPIRTLLSTNLSVILSCSCSNFLSTHQGLDDRNERLVFKRIVTNSTREPGNSPTDHSGQYWLITPKVRAIHCSFIRLLASCFVPFDQLLTTPPVSSGQLLPNLNDMEEEAMTILVVTNGPGNFNNNDEWNTLLGKGDKRALVSEAEYDDEDSDNVPRRKSKRSRLS